MPAAAVGWCQAAGVALLQQREGPGVGRDGVGEQLDLQGGAASEHFSQMAQQSETGDVRAGMDAAAVGLQLVQQLMLAEGHHTENVIEGRRRRRTGHRCGKQHTRPQRTAHEQGITRLDSSLGPAGARAASVDTQGQLQAEFRRLRGVAAGFQRVSTDEGRPLFRQHGAHSRQGLHQQLLLLPGLEGRQGHHSLSALHSCSAGPEIGAGVQRRQASVQPGITQESRKAVNALQQRRVGRDRGGILRSSVQPHLPQCRFQGFGGQLGCTATTGHGCFRFHGSSPVKSLHEASVDPPLPAPEQW